MEEILVPNRNLTAHPRGAPDVTRPAPEADVIVLGVGTCGEDLSLRLLRAGLDVIGVEAALVGGECAYWACLPSKLMIRAANLVQEARRVDGKAGRVEVRPDWSLVAARVRGEVTGDWDDSSAMKRFADHGGQLVKGRGRLIGPGRVAVGDAVYAARRGVVIATGSSPLIPAIPGLSDVEFWTTHDVIRAEHLPRSLVVIGGSAVGCELGQVLARFGVAVTIVEGRDRLLPAEEPEASSALANAMRAEGVAVHAGSSVERLESRGPSIAVHLAGGAVLEAERVLVATGRKVDVSGLGLESVGLDGTARLIAVDERMRAADGLWAMGDVTGKAMLTHVALYQSSIVAADLLGLPSAAARYDAVPRVTFTDPEVGAVGMTEAIARQAGIDVVVAVKQVGATFRGWLHGATDGIIKFVADRSTGTLVGATVVGPRAGDVLGLLTLAVHTGTSLDELRSMMYAFPTFHGGVGEALGAYGRGLSAAIDPPYAGFDSLDAVVKSGGPPGAGLSPRRDADQGSGGQRST